MNRENDMTLTNYWWLLIWLFIAGIIFSQCSIRKSEIVLGRKEQRWSFIPAIILACPYIIWAAFRSDVWGDTYSYRYLYRMVPSSLNQLVSYVSSANKDKGFQALSVIIKSIFGDSDIILFFILALFQMICIVLVFRKYSCDYWLSIFLFVASTDYMSWMHNGIRQFTAVTLIFAATGLMLKKKYVSLIIVILIASTIHGSALLMIPIVFIIQGKAWNKKTLFCIFLSLLALVFVNQFTNILDTLLSDTQYTNVVSDWESMSDNGTNPIRVLVYSVPTILSLIGYKYIKKVDDPVINMSVNAGIVATAISIISMGTSGVFIGRLPIFCSMYSTGILLPWEIKNIFTKDSSKIMIVATIVCYIVFFYYQMHFAWNLL